MSLPNRAPSLASNQTTSGYPVEPLGRDQPTDSDVMLTDLLTVAAKKKQAEREGFYIEAIDLAAYECEFLLMLWLAGVARRSTATARRTLGGWITEADKEQFDGSLIRRLRAFNEKRGQAVHRLLRGEIRYGDLKAEVLDADPKLVMHVAMTVVEDLEQGMAAKSTS